jgi:hypothetical protein
VKLLVELFRTLLLWVFDLVGHQTYFSSNQLILLPSQTCPYIILFLGMWKENKLTIVSKSETKALVKIPQHSSTTLHIIHNLSNTTWNFLIGQRVHVLTT